MKNAIAYDMALPLYHVLEEAFSKKLYRDPLPEQGASIGFVEHSVARKLIPILDDNTIAFEVQLAKKRVPTSAIKEGVRRRCAEIEEQLGYNPGRKERAEIKEEVTLELLRGTPAALSRVECLYDPGTRILLIGTGSQVTADEVTALLIHTLEAVQTRTLNVSDPARGLTTKLRAWSLDGYEPDIFHPFTLGQVVVFANEKQRISVRNRELDETYHAVDEALDKGFLVKELALQTDNIAFRLTDKFHFKGIQLTDLALESEELFDDAIDAWQHETSVLFLEMRAVVDSLVKLLGRDRLPEEEKAAA